MESREGLTTNPLQAWHEETQRREQIVEELREEYRDILQPVLDLVETAPPAWSPDSPIKPDLYFENLWRATAEAIPQIVPGPDQEGVESQKLASFFTEVASTPSETVSKALIYLLDRGELRADENWRITKSIPE